MVRELQLIFNNIFKNTLPLSPSSHGAKGRSQGRYFTKQGPIIIQALESKQSRKARILRECNFNNVLVPAWLLGIKVGIREGTYLKSTIIDIKARFYTQFRSSTYLTNEPWNLGAFAPQCKNSKIGAGNWISASGSTFNCQTCVFDAHCTATLFILHGVMVQKRSCWLRWIVSSLSSCIGRFRWSPWALIVSVSAIIFTIPNTIFFIMLRTIVNMMIASDWESPAPADRVLYTYFHHFLLFY